MTRLVKWNIRALLLISLQFFIGWALGGRIGLGVVGIFVLICQLL